jgi:large subunit ribosomal protein L7e
VLKKRKRQEQWAAEKAATAKAAEAKGIEKKKEMFKRAEAYVAEYRSAEQQLVQMKRAARKAGTFYVEPVRLRTRGLPQAGEAGEGQRAECVSVR